MSEDNAVKVDTAKQPMPSDPRAKTKRGVLACRCGNKHDVYYGDWAMWKCPQCDETWMWAPTYYDLCPAAARHKEPGAEPTGYDYYVVRPTCGEETRYRRFDSYTIALRNYRSTLLFSGCVRSELVGVRNGTETKLEWFGL